MAFTYTFQGVTITLPTPRSDVRTWGGLLNAALQAIMEAVGTKLSVSTSVNADTTLTVEHSGTGPPVRIVGKSAAPTTGLAAGALYYDTDDNKLYLYNGSAWKQITSAS